MHFASGPEKVLDALATDSGRASFWAESAPESDGRITRQILNYEPLRGAFFAASGHTCSRSHTSEPSSSSLSRMTAAGEPTSRCLQHGWLNPLGRSHRSTTRFRAFYAGIGNPKLGSIVCVCKRPIFTSHPLQPAAGFLRAIQQFRGDSWACKEERPSGRHLFDELRAGFSNLMDDGELDRLALLFELVG